MRTYEFPPDTGHESDYRATSSEGIYLLPRPQPQPSLYAQIIGLEKWAAEKPADSYGRRELMGHAARHRATLAAAGRPVPPVADLDPAEQEASPEELAQLGCVGNPTEEAADGVREAIDDDGVYYGETAEEAFHRD